MSDIAIRVEKLGKRYRIGASKTAFRYKTLQETLVQTIRNPLKGIIKPKDNLESSNILWALNDLSFEIEQGEVVGIIGRNGAGKSTLLKILSHITEPTTGRVRLYGRVGSLLEVGTGFHPELTGRENIYLNGSILGMRRTEIDRKFDEIVEFSEIEKFLDTPVKRYSSGMYVRLAFSVAAHLETEILLIDEVLAVGDFAFQKKCLGKMGNVAHQGRTVLFVSHNLQAISTLCNRGILLSRGEMKLDGNAGVVVKQYLMDGIEHGAEVIWDPKVAPGNNLIRLNSVRLKKNDGEVTQEFLSSEPILIQLEFNLRKKANDLVIGFDLKTSEGFVVMRCYHNDASEEYWPYIKIGKNIIECQLPPGLLNAGNYFICPKISNHCREWIVDLDSLIVIKVILSHGVSPFWTVLDGTNRPGAIAPIIPWHTIDSD
jgi:lipopolysaccharide transport system ATP-binding protein